jgi:hypothetical protein
MSTVTTCIVNNAESKFGAYNISAFDKKESLAGNLLYERNSFLISKNLSLL